MRFFFSVPPPDYRKSDIFENSDNPGHKYLEQSNICAKSRKFCLHKNAKISQSNSNDTEIRIGSKSLDTRLLETIKFIEFAKRPKILSPKS